MKRILSLVLALALILSLSPAALAEEPVTIKLVTRNIGSATSSDNDIHRAIEEAIGVNIEIDLKPGSDYATTCQMVLAGNELPDAMEWHCSTFPTDLQNLADDGLILPLDDLLAEYGTNILNCRGDDYFFRSSTDGKIYGIPCRTMEYGNNNYAAIRQDWLDKLGLAMPTSSDELFKVLTAFKENAAELVGEGVQFWPMGAYSEQMGIANAIWDIFASENGLVANWNKVGDELVYHINMPGYKQTLATIRKFYQAGLIDPEYPLMTRDDMLEKWYNNGYGMWHFYLDVSDPYLDSWFKTYNGYYPEAKLGNVAAFPDENGVARIDGAYEPQMFVIFNTCENPEAVMKFLNYLCTDEAVDLVQLGIEGVDWEQDENGKVTQYEIAPERKEPMGYKSYYLLMMPIYLSPARCYDSSVIDMAMKNKDIAVTPYVLGVTETQLDAGTTMNDLEKTYATRLIVEADIDFDAVFDEYVTKWNEVGGAEWTKEYNELYKVKYGK